MSGIPNVTKRAAAYVKFVRRSSDLSASWFDVALAYDAGLRDAVHNRKAAKWELILLSREGRDVYASDGFRRRERMTP